MKKRKEYLGILGVLMSLMFIPLEASARHDSTNVGDFAGGIMGSRHNLSHSGQVLHTLNSTMLNPVTWEMEQFDASNSPVSTSEACAICHTPHFTDRSEGPMWNRNRAGGPISAYGNTIAENSDGNANMFSTLACLSCHDGVTTFDNLVNRPGKGLGSGDQNWLFQMRGQNNPLPGSPFALDHFSASDCTNSCHDAGQRDIGRLTIGEQVDVGGTTITDLRNDHPIGVVYRGAGDIGASASLRATSTVLSKINLNIAAENFNDIEALVTGNLWAVKGFISSEATISNLLRTGEGAASDDSRQFVQCSSCHDVHYKNQTNPDRDFFTTYDQWLDPPTFANPPVTNHDAFEIDGLFLRRVGGNSDSGVCRTCHAK